MRRFLLLLAFLAVPCYAAESWQWMLFDPQDGCSQWREGWAVVSMAKGHITINLQDVLNGEGGANVLTVFTGRIQHRAVVRHTRARHGDDSDTVTTVYRQTRAEAIQGTWVDRQGSVPPMALSGNYFYAVTRGGGDSQPDAQESIVLSNGDVVLRLQKVGTKPARPKPQPQPQPQGDPAAQY